MKYNTISTSSLSSEGRKSTLTLYTDPDFLNDKVSSSESEISSVRGELEIVQRALKLQTRRCRQLVAEYTRRLQEKEQQYQSEKLLRDNQLAKVLRALLIFEARLKQEQKFITHQLEEKDYIINKQREDINKLTASQYCKQCNQFYTTTYNKLPSLDSSTEYIGTDYQSSNFDSSSETYDKVKLSDKNDNDGKLFAKNKCRDVATKRGRKITHRKSVGTYFEVLKLRNDSPTSNEDNTSNDYENLESLPGESVSDHISLVSERIENIFQSKNDLTESNLDKHDKNEVVEEKAPKINENIPVFDDGGDPETNDNWYASASDQEDDQQRDIYRNNPVLECMNQILMQNINDNLSSPPKTPNLERRVASSTNNKKKVKFSDEEDVQVKDEHNKVNYYETPIQKVPNFYETPQSIYSNDYEQILSQCSEKSEVMQPKAQILYDNEADLKDGHYYVDMDAKNESDDVPTVRKTKILRTPPALPPKPANLLSKYKMGKIQNVNQTPSIDSEPDYCSISELNLPPSKISKLNVVAEINIPSNQESMKISEKHIILHSPKQQSVKLQESLKLSTKNDKNLVMNKGIEKANVQIAKINVKPKKIEPEIPKLPQVSEIIIPDENEPKKEERISHDNYIKNNSQLLKTKTRSDGRRSILMGSSVSSLISSFNNAQLLNELHTKPKFLSKSNKKMFSSFECLQNVDKHSLNNDQSSGGYEKFDLSQNFEEFKLDDCDIEGGECCDGNNADSMADDVAKEEHVLPDILVSPKKCPVAVVDDVGLNTATVQQFKKKLEIEVKLANNPQIIEPNYEHFLECTGLSSKSILTPSRLLSNHKSMLKPKDVKLRSKVKSNVFERQNSTNQIKYWSEPYI